MFLLPFFKTNLANDNRPKTPQKVIWTQALIFRAELLVSVSASWTSALLKLFSTHESSFPKKILSIW